MQSHAVVLERAKESWSGQGEPTQAFLTGFLLGHRAAEVDQEKSCPEGKDPIAYGMGYDYAARLSVRFADDLPKKRTR